MDEQETELKTEPIEKLKFSLKDLADWNMIKLSEVPDANNARATRDNKEADSKKREDGARKG